MQKPNGIQIASILQVGALASMIAGGVAYFQTADSARVEHELIAQDRATEDLRLRLRLVNIEIKRLADISENRELTEAEKSELRGLEAERAVLLERLETKV